MKQTWFKRLLALALCVMLVLIAALPAGADFGDYSGDSDFGDSSDWSSSDSSWDSSDWDSDSYADSSDGGTLGLSFWVIGIILIVAFVSTNVGGKKKRKAGGGVSWSAAANRKLKPMSEYTQLDEAFDETELTSKLSNLYVQMQDCWQKKDISPIRPYCTDAFFTQMDNQLQRKKQKGQTNYVERIAVLSVDLRGWCQEGGNDVLVARLKTRIVDYTLDDATGSLVSGDRNKEKFMTYEWDLVRPTGTKTEAGGNMQTVSCPHCGAPLEINASAKCPYCGSVITLEEHGFALNAIRAIFDVIRCCFSGFNSFGVVGVLRCSHPITCHITAAFTVMLTAQNITTTTLYPKVTNLIRRVRLGAEATHFSIRSRLCPRGILQSLLNLLVFDNVPIVTPTILCPAVSNTR